MQKTLQLTETDEKGRIYLPMNARQKYGRKFLLIELPNGIKLVPVPKDPIQDLQQVMKKISKKDIQTIKKEIQLQALKEAEHALRRH